MKDIIDMVLSLPGMARLEFSRVVDIHIEVLVVKDEDFEQAQKIADLINKLRKHSYLTFTIIIE